MEIFTSTETIELNGLFVKNMFWLGSEYVLVGFRICFGWGQNMFWLGSEYVLVGFRIKGSCSTSLSVV